MMMKNKYLPNELVEQQTIARILFLQFLTDELPTLMQICKPWHTAIKHLFHQDTNLIKSKFQQTFSQAFTIEQSANFILNQQLVFYKTPDGLKTNIDFLLRLNLKEKYNFEVGSKYTISYSYQLASLSRKKLMKSKKRAKKYFWRLEFSYVGDNSKTVWMYKDYKSEKCYQSDDQVVVKQLQTGQDTIPYIMDCLPVRSNQTIQLRLPICVRNSLIPPTNLQFYPLQHSKPHSPFTLLSPLNSLQTFFTPLPQTTCPIESLYHWKPYDYFSNPISFQLDDAVNCYKKELKLQKIDVNDVGNHFRIQFKCRAQIRQGKFMGHDFVIVKENGKFNKSAIGKSSIVELKRKGIYEERQNRLQLAVGDRLIVYLSQVKDQ